MTNKTFHPKEDTFLLATIPLGGIDFFAAILSISDNYNNIRAIANKLLMPVKPLQKIFLAVNVFGKNSEKNKKTSLKPWHLKIFK